MLVSIAIQNIVLIDRLTVAFAPGFCALTGETGAGKSILLDALGLALGARADSGLVRRGAGEASVTALFEVSSSHPCHDLLRDASVIVDAGEPVILRRTLRADGGSRAFVNDQLVSVGLLRQIGETLVEIHGQFDTQGLFDPATHRRMLDSYAGMAPDETAKAWEGWAAARAALEQAVSEMDKARAEESYLRQALEDIDALSPEAGEEEKLAAQRDRLMRRGQIVENLGGAYDIMGEIDSLAGRAGRMLERIGDDARTMLESLDRAAAEIQEIVAGLQSLSADMEEGDAALGAIDDRLFALRAQARKHRCAVDDLPALRDDLARRLSLIETQEDVLGDLSRAVAAARTEYIHRAEAARQKRQKAALRLDRLVAAELAPLRLEKATFTTDISLLGEPDWGSQGMDEVRFQVATNPGAAPGPLQKIASGGEMARFMLALKVVLAGVGSATSLVFDEADSGIGGATASAVAERLARLAQDKQVLVVTHSPQVAARAAHHWIVRKEGAAAVTTRIVPLPDATARREEIARMLAGAEISAEARAAADKLLEAGL